MMLGNFIRHRLALLNDMAARGLVIIIWVKLKRMIDPM